ncbi:plasmid replication protein RepH [Halocatena marina]|uniref:plasmid replication protein RepH n=1 Tax=Halocatena marina TaxID=2934937 RepID=UPI00361A532B
MTNPQLVGLPNECGIRPVLPGQTTQRSIPAAAINRIPPQVSKWLPELLENLLPTTAASLRTLAARYDDAYGTNIIETRRPGPFVYEYLCEVHGADALATHYASALTEYALKFEPAERDKLPEHHQNHHDDLKRFLTQFGTGSGPFTRDIDALTRGPLAIHRQDPTPNTVWVTLDAQAWDNVSDQRTAATSLATLAALEKCSMLRSFSPHPASCVIFAVTIWSGLTSISASSTLLSTGFPVSKKLSANADEIEIRTTAFTALANLDEQGGRVRLLASLPDDGYREQRMLVEDPEIDLAESTISNYLGDLTAAGLVAVDSLGRTHNRVSLTAAGEIAQDYIVDNYTLRSPHQSTLDQDFVPTPHDSTSRVYCTQQHDREDKGPSTAEAWLAETGSADTNGYTAWLDGPTNTLDSRGMHQRLSAAQRSDGVTLVDHKIEPFDDGRMTYLSCFEDDVQAVVQWGGPLPTLARCTATLLSDHAFSRLLTPDALGKRFENLYDEFKENVDRILVKGAQIGWFGKNEHEYSQFKDRYRKIRNICLKQLPNVLRSNKTEEYSNLFRDLHGLFASTTQLYDAAGFDVTIQLRIPDTEQLQRGNQRYQSFLKFFGHTVPKHTVYESDIGVHSGYREVLEDRDQKLESRLDYNIDVTAPYARCTVSWVVSGPDATEFRTDVYQAIQSRAATIREEVQEGNEKAPLLEIPVMSGMTYPTIKATVAHFADQKGYVTDRADLLERGIHDRRPLERCIRVLTACLSTSEQPGSVSPFDVAEALLHCSQTAKTEPLSVSEIAYGLAHLPADRLLPSLAPSATKVVQALLQTDIPIGRNEICERAGISSSSYDRYIDELAALAIIEPHTVEGRRKWTAHLEPEWTPDSSTVSQDEDHPLRISRESWLRDILKTVTNTTDFSLNDCEGWPLNIPNKHKQDVSLIPWLQFVAAQFGIIDLDRQIGNELSGRKIISTDDRSVALSRTLQQTAVIGVKPDDSESIQTTLTRVTSETDSISSMMNSLYLR